MLTDVIEWMRLPFRKDRQLRLSLYHILGFYPRNIAHYELALMHKSMFKRNAKGKPINNERLEFLGDAILDATVGDIVFRHFPGKREGFLTNVRSKLVKREMLNRLAEEMGLMSLLHTNGCSLSHNSYVGGNAFEALVGAIYVDRGYNACMRFVERRILKQVLNIDKVAYKETNFKSKLIEWCQKNHVKLEFRLTEQTRDKNGSPFFVYTAVLGGVDGATGRGYSKKESQQQASKLVLAKLRREPHFIDSVFASNSVNDDAQEPQAMSQKTAASPLFNDVCVDPEWEKKRRKQQKANSASNHNTKETTPSSDDGASPTNNSFLPSEQKGNHDDIREFDPSREDIISKAEELAFAEQ